MDGLRGIAASAVLLGHAQVIMGEQTWVSRKYLAVQFFFMLSGFVVGYAYEKRIINGMPVTEFYLRRIIRLYPLIILGTMLGTIWYALGDAQFQFNSRSLLAIGLAALALPSPYTHFSFGRFPINPPEWSLYLEVTAYLAFGALIKYMTNFRLALLCSLSFVSYTIVQYFYFYSPETPFFLNGFGLSYSFSMGLIIWRGFYIKTLPHVKLPFPILGLLLLSACIIPKSLGWTADALCVALLFPMLIVSAAAPGPRKEKNIIQILGSISYPLYILHWPVLQATKQLLLYTTGPSAATAIGCTAAVALAYGALHLYDVPVREWLASKLIHR